MRNSISVYILLLIVPLCLISGCITTTRPPGGGTDQSTYIRPPAISQNTLDKRIDEIKILLKENSLTDDRQETALSIIKAYDKLKSLSKGNTSEKEYRKTVQIIFKSLVDLEQQYLYSGLTTGNAVGKKIIENYTTQKEKIIENYYSGDFNGVISGCNELVEKYGEAGLTSEIGIILFEAFLKSNMTERALALARNIIDRSESRPDIVRLMSNAIELELKNGDIEGAKSLYEKLVDNINEKNNLYIRAGNKITEYEGDVPVVDESVKEQIAEIDPEKSALTRQLIDDVEKMISEKDFSGAKIALYRWKFRTEEGPELEMIEKLFESVDKAEDQFNNANNDYKQVIDDAQKLIEEEKYEEALALLEPVIAESRNYEADKLKKEAVDKLIIRDTRKASQYWSIAKETNDVEKSRNILLEAKTMLVNLVKKYPDHEYLKFADRNIAIIDKDLMDLPPAAE